MKATNKTNSTALHIWIAENGDHAARELICKEAVITTSTLCRILKGAMPRFENRYRIYKLTGIKLNDDDQFPEQRQNAS
jgi:predicted transcriptional regulator